MALPEKRWIQRLDNYEKAVAVLENAFSVSQERELTELEKMGLIQAFEMTFELAWNLMKDFLRYIGIFEIMGSKDTIKRAFSNGIIDNAQVWIDMIDSRNETSHCYDEVIAIRVVTSVTRSYIEEMRNFLETMNRYKKAEE
jgi:nucleotidyltransferase substrate binding protein (TIGR01987 family)